MRRLLPIVLVLLLGAQAHAAGDPLRPQQYGLDIVESDAAHAVTRGAGAKVAVIDTGVLAGHADLQGRIGPGHDFVDSDSDPQDGNGHGTHVSGIIAANDGNGVGVSSVAPDATIMPVRVLGNDGTGDSTAVDAGIDWAVDNGADVINLSLGAELPIEALLGSSDPSIDRALDKGVIVVAAAGNGGFPICENPSGRGRLLCVGAVNQQRQRTGFSSFGFGLGVMGPGQSVLSTYNDGAYRPVSGTSQATPHVAGVAALLVSLGVRGQSAVNRILATASDAGPKGPDFEYGAGIVNARAAVAGFGSAGAGGGAAVQPPARQPAGSAARISVSRLQRKVLRRGIQVRCRAAGAGSCKVIVQVGRRVIARGSKAIKAGPSVTVTARLTRAGRALLRIAPRVRARVTVALPGADPQAKTVVLVG